VTHRPCGACRSLVLVTEGCQHWKPGRSAKAADSAERRRQAREELATFRRQMDVTR
jgi:hypothetical protein